MNGRRRFDLPRVEDTRSLGRLLGGMLRAGDLVVLTGGLGAGKTTLTQGIAEGLGVRGPVTSPTFVIARVHPSTVGGPALVHVDAYRLGGGLELDDLDLDTSVDGQRHRRGVGARAGRGPQRGQARGGARRRPGHGGAHGHRLRGGWTVVAGHHRRCTGRRRHVAWEPFGAPRSAGRSRSWVGSRADPRHRHRDVGDRRGAERRCAHGIPTAGSTPRATRNTSRPSSGSSRG